MKEGRNEDKEGSMTDALPLIRLEAVTKIFYTDEVETHALSGIHLDIHDG